MRDHPSSRPLTVALVVLVGLLALAIRLPGLGARSLTSAEQRVLAASQGLDPSRPLPEDVSLRPADLAPREGVVAIARGARRAPLYAGALAFWSQGLGTSERALRWPSAVGGALAAVAAAWIAALLAGPWAAALAGLLVALSPIHVLASRQAGPEAVASLVLVVSLGLTLRLGRSGRTGLAAVLGLLLGLLATGPPALLGLAVLMLAWLARRPEGRRSFVVAAGVAALVAVAAGAGGLLRSPLAEGAELSWVPATTVLGAIRCAGASFTRVAGLEYHLVVSHARSLAPVTLAIIALALFGARRLEAGPRGLLLGGVAVPFVLGAALALLTGTVAPLQAHRMLPALPFLAVLVGVGLGGLPPRLRWGASVAVVGGLAAFVSLALATPPQQTSPTRAGCSHRGDVRVLDRAGPGMSFA